MAAEDTAREAVTPAQLAVVARDVATAAARAVASQRPAGGVVETKSSDTDLVTDVDRATEVALIEAIRRRRPEDSVLGEEGGASAGTTGSRVQWVIDPIDGTVNFVLGIPMYSVSVAARLDGRVVAGCVVDAVRGEVFHAHLGGGAFVIADGVSRRLSGPRVIPLTQAVIGTGFAYSAEVRARQGVVVASVLPRVGNIRRLGSAALDLCYVAAGRLDGYYEAGTNDWDRAAGILIVEEAGARSGTLPGRTLQQSVVAAGVGLFEELTVMLTALDAGAVMDG